ncbi:hypothetical protein Zmor_001922 [Zophobas morio]|uniref:Major facilitator superfamily (MFS) profile domain-containing protein n=1 Tax=Zophobas morio TaxID=2755281 RepID=A0AA38J3M7_9CUCU|nr:hypothetical protein Zmor_001922 [Zophobas morio]
MKVNRKLLPIKLHYFLFMAALGPILPQLPLLGKDIGISAIVMGTVTGILPFTFLLTKPFFGLLIDVYRQWRKPIFLFLIFVMTLSFCGIYFVPSRETAKFEFDFIDYTFWNACSKTVFPVVCNSSCLPKSLVLMASVKNEQSLYQLCLTPETHFLANLSKCSFVCVEDPDNGLYSSFTFWSFIIFMSVGTIGFNVVNSISDAICFDIVEDQSSYGNQRLWGSIGFGFAGLISGYIIDMFSKTSANYVPAFVIMTLFSILDLFVCAKFIELPVMEAPKNIFNDLKVLLTNVHVVTFITFTVLAGMLDGLIIYFLFWYLEDLAIETGTTQVKLIEGLTLAAETIGAEALFFLISGKILQRLGHVHTFTMCFMSYALRLALISAAPSPWWFLPIEFFMQGPTFALTYTAIVAYANELAPPGMSATMQGIASGMGDGAGYAVGSVVGGLFYRYLGGKATFQTFTWVTLFCGIMHFILHASVLKRKRNAIRPDYEEID